MVRLSARTTDDAVDLMRLEMPNLLEDMSNRSSSNMATTLGADGYITVETLTTFRFDNRNNRISRTVTGAESYVMTYTYDLNNRLLQKTRTGSNPSVTTFTYDRNGNQLTQTTGNSTKGLIYDAFNHLVRVVHGNMVAVYEYRADGLRLSKTVNGHTTTHVWDRGNIILEMNGSGAVVNRFSRGLGHLIHSYHHGFYLFNVRGDVVQRVDNDGNVIHTYRYDAFGNQLNGNETNTNPFRFAGEYWDWSSGFIYLRARFFNPAIGRFISEDPYWTIHNMQFGTSPRIMNVHSNRSTMMPDAWVILQAGNLFVFCANNPVQFIDPSGESLKLALIAAAAVAAGKSNNNNNSGTTSTTTVTPSSRTAVARSTTTSATRPPATTTTSSATTSGVGSAANNAVTNATINAILRGQRQPTSVSVDVRKFSEYIFRDGANHGKETIFRSLGYSSSDSRTLVNIFQNQARAKIASGNYTLGRADSYGQRINVEIELRGVGNMAGETSFIRSGWLIRPDGSITLNTPFSGFTR